MPREKAAYRENLEREQTTIRLPAELKEQLQREAVYQGVTKKDVIVFILWEYFENTVQE